MAIDAAIHPHYGIENLIRAIQEDDVAVPPHHLDDEPKLSQFAGLTDVFHCDFQYAL
jgi:hypothetical protein